MVDTRGPVRRRSLLDGALAVVDAGPKWFFRSALTSFALTCLLAFPIILRLPSGGPGHSLRREMIVAALAGLCAVLLVALAGMLWAGRGKPERLDQIAAPAQRAAIWLALTVWFPFLLFIAYYRVRAALPRTVRWIAFGYEDKRWETAGYLLAALAPMLLLVAATAVLRAGRAHPASWRAWFAGLSLRSPRTEPEPDQAGTDPDLAAEPETAAEAPVSLPRFPGQDLLRSWQVRVTAGVLTALALAYYFYGPPWYLNRSSGAIGAGFQEDVFLAGFQAISKGGVPYIGPAAEQYGPGAQLLSYLFMRHVSTFSVVGFRESWAMYQWVGASILFVALFLVLGYFRGAIAALLSALVYPALQQIGFMPRSAYTGFFAWASPLRYAGAICLVLLLPAVIKRCPAKRGLAGAVVLGMLWGGLSYVAQENLLAGAVGAVAMGALLVLSGTSAWRPVWTALCGVLCGSVVVWIPVIVYYAGKGLLTRFLYLYFLMPQAVAEGYSNTPFGGRRHDREYFRVQKPWELMFHALPVVLCVLALLAIVQFRPFRIAQSWSRDRILLVSLVLTTVVLYQGAMLRADKAHLTGTMLVVPALVIAVATLLPKQLGVRTGPMLVLGGVVLFGASFLLLPRQAYKPSAVRAVLEAPARDRIRLARKPAGAAPTSLAAARMGAGLITTRHHCCQWSPGSHTMPMPDFIALMNKLHSIIGGRTTYVVSFPDGYPGLIYFVADLNPAPIPLDPHTMVLNEPQRRAFLRDFRASVLPRTQALVTSKLSAAEARIFLKRYPGARRIALTYSGHPYWVLLAPASGHR